MATERLLVTFERSSVGQISRGLGRSTKCGNGGVCHGIKEKHGSV